MGREWLFKENPFDLIKKIENAVYACSPALKHRQAGLLLPLVHPACLCPFHFNWQILRAGNRAAPTWFAWTSATGWFLWLISSNVGVLLCKNCLHKHPDCSYRLKMKTNLSSVQFSSVFFHSKWLRTASAYVLSPPWSSSFSLSCSWSCLFLLVCAFHHCLSSIYFSLHISVSFPAVGGSIGWAVGGAFKALESWENDPTGFDSMSASA